MLLPLSLVLMPSRVLSPVQILNSVQGPEPALFAGTDGSAEAHGIGLQATALHTFMPHVGVSGFPWGAGYWDSRVNHLGFYGHILSNSQSTSVKMQMPLSCSLYIPTCLFAANLKIHCELAPMRKASFLV